MESILFLLSKLAWAVIAPDSMLLIFVLFIWVMLWQGRIRLAKLSFSSLAIILLVVALFPVGEWLLSPLETRFPVNPLLPNQIDGIIVLTGAKIVPFSAPGSQVQVNRASKRDFVFLTLAKQYPEAKLVVTGGSSNLLDREHRAADAAKALFSEQGLDVSRVIFERDSRNTLENASLSKALAKPRHGEKWLLVTSAFHMPRSVGIFCKAGWPVIPYPVDHRTLGDNLFRMEISLAGHLGDLNVGIREWLGLLTYYVTGKSTHLLPLECDY